MKYSSDTIQQRANELLEAMQKSQAQMLEDLELNKNALNTSPKNGMASFSLARIADYLGCSVDYLLGRETKPVETERDTLAAILRQLPESDIDELIHFAEFLLAKQQRQAEPKDQ